MWPFRKHTKVTPPVSAPVDLDTPVTNPDLLVAMSDFHLCADRPRIDALLRELNRCNFLMVTILDQANMRIESQGQGVFKKGSLFKVPILIANDDRQLLPLFTDWEAIRKWTNDPVSSLVTPAKESWDFALAQYEGVVINPGGPQLELNRDQLEVLRQRCLSD